MLKRGARFIGFVAGVTLLMGIAVTQSLANICTTGVAVPPFLGTGVDPNLMMVVDNSASMYDLAYVEDAATCFDDSYDSANTYAGLFDEDQWYGYDEADDWFEPITAAEATAVCNSSGDQFKTDAAGKEICLQITDGTFAAFVSKGKFLNWVMSSKMDIEKKILTGGKYDDTNDVLIMESRGCLERRFVRQARFDGAGGYLTLAVRQPTSDEKVDEIDNASRIDLFPVTSGGYNYTACQQAVDEMKSGNPSLGQLKGYIDDCMGYPSGGGGNDPEVASRSAFNHSVQDCWYLAKHGVWPPGSGSVQRMKNDCSSVYSALLPWDIFPDHSGYVCFGDHRRPSSDPLFLRGYVGRCWDTGGGTGDPLVCIDRECNGEGSTGNPRCIDGYLYQCDGNYNSNQDSCKGNPGQWVKMQECTGGGGSGGSAGWISDDCIDLGLKDFCGAMSVPEVVDPSDQVTGTGDETGEYWNLPAMMVDSGVVEQVGTPLITMIGHITQPDVPSGLLQEFSESIRMGAMTFNYDGAKSECSVDADFYVTNDCDNPDILDAAKVVTAIGKGDQHTIDLVAAVNAITAETWTPLGEAMYSAVGYYRQDDSILGDTDLNVLAGATVDHPITNWCQFNNIMIITDGAPTADQNPNMMSFAEALDYQLGSGTCPALHGSTYLDDLSKYAFDDIWSDKTFTLGEEWRNVTTHIVAAGSFRGDPDPDFPKCFPQNLLEAAAQSGGTELYQAENLNELEETLRTAFNAIRAGASAGSAASVISASRGGEGAIYQAIFWPSKPSSDLSSDAEVEWAGEVHSLFIDAQGSMYEDTDGNLQLTSDDKRVYIYFDDTDLVTKGCYVKPVDGACGDSVDLDEVRYLWSANNWLAKIAHSATFAPFDANDVHVNRSGTDYISNKRQRYIFTWNDLDNDGIVDEGEVLDFISRDTNDDPIDWGGMSVADSRSSVLSDFNAANNTEVNKVIDWIRGSDEYADLRSRTVAKPIPGQITDPEVVWRLGDVVHSTPTAVSRPMENLHLMYGDISYNKFVTRWADRRHVIYFGANDGMLHAVNGGFYDADNKKFCLTDDCINESGAPELGAELWAYVPYNLLPHLKCLTDPNYNHKYYVDQQPRVFDAKIFTPSDTHVEGWGTILVGSMRFGGAPVGASTLAGADATDNRVFTSSYFVLDITNPEAPPVLLGELTMQTGGVDMGFTIATPTAVVMKDTENNVNDWYLVLGSGPTAANADNAIKGFSEQKPQVAVIPLKGLADGDVAFRVTDSAPTSTTTGTFELGGDDGENGFVSDLITVDFERNYDYSSDAVYFGTVEQGSVIAPPSDGQSYDDAWGGKMYRLVMDPDNTKATTDPSDWEASLLIDAGQPITAAPTVGTDTFNYWIYFGTGRFLDTDIDKPDDAQQSFYGIKEPVNCTDGTFTWNTVSKDTDIIDVSDVVVTEATASIGDIECTVGEETCNRVEQLVAYIAGSPSAVCTEGAFADYKSGWVRDFSRASERNVGQATLVGGLLTFTTYQPFEDVCKEDGQSFLYGLHYQTGTPTHKTAFGAIGIEGTGDDAVIMESVDVGRGLATTPNLHVSKGGPNDGPTAFIQTSTGEIVEIPQTNLPEQFRTGRRSWRER